MLKQNVKAKVFDCYFEVSSNLSRVIRFTFELIHMLVLSVGAVEYTSHISGEG